MIGTKSMKVGTRNMNESFQPLFTPFTLPCGVELKNRIIMAPMTTYSANADDTVSEEELAYYTRRANDVSMVVTACTYVQANGKGFDGQFAGDRDEMIPSMKRLASTIKNHGAKAILQLYHGGRHAKPSLVQNGEIVAPSSVVSENDKGAYMVKKAPRSMTDTEILQLIEAFGQTTRRAIEAGFDGVELHGANGFILQQFFSPFSNQRTDRWGGSLKNRLAFPLAIIEEVQKVVKHYAKEPFIIGYRLSPEEPETTGITMKDTFNLVDAIADKGLDYIHISMLDFWSEARRGVDAVRPRIELIQEKVGERIPIIGVGSIRSANDAIRAIQSTDIPLLALGRELIMEPDWVGKIVRGQEEQIHTSLSRKDQQKLCIPDPLWKQIIETKGWFPLVD